MRNNSKKTTIKFYLRPEFFLIILTAFLWLAFLLKVLIYDKEETIKIPKVVTHDKVTKTYNGRFKIKNHAKQEKNQFTNKEEKNQEQTPIEDLQESLDKVKPAGNLIIRGEQSMTLIQKKSGRNAMPPTELIINKGNLKKLNADYMKALKTTQ